MTTFIDESGDTGPIKEGVSPFFRLSAVWVPTIDDAESFRGKIKHLRKDLGLPESHEFKFTKTHNWPELRGAFFSIALSQEFRFAVSAFDKREISCDAFRHAEQHWACCTELAATFRVVYHKAEKEMALPQNLWKRERPLRERIASWNTPRT